MAENAAKKIRPRQIANRAPFFCLKSRTVTVGCKHFSENHRKRYGKVGYVTVRVTNSDALLQNSIIYFDSSSRHHPIPRRSKSSNVLKRPYGVHKRPYDYSEFGSKPPNSFKSSYIVRCTPSSPDFSQSNGLVPIASNLSIKMMTVLFSFSKASSRSSRSSFLQKNYLK